MGLFKDFKEDFSQAAKELMPDEGKRVRDEDDNIVVDTLGEDVDVKSELSKLDGLLEQVNERKPEPVAHMSKQPSSSEVAAASAAIIRERMMNAQAAAPKTIQQQQQQEEKIRMNQTLSNINQAVNKVAEQQAAEDETTVITASTTLSGDIATAGSLEVQGTINGNVTSNGKVVVTGTINGNTTASEVFADVASIEGEIVTTGTVKIGAGSVIVGNISASSAVVAGAVKGDIDVQGPVVIDTSAVIMGNIKSRSVQINNGAVIEGFCSQSYSEVDVESLFGRAGA